MKLKNSHNKRSLYRMNKDMTKEIETIYKTNETLW